MTGRHHAWRGQACRPQIVNHSMVRKHDHQRNRDEFRGDEAPAPRSLLLPLGLLILCVFLWPAVVTFDAGDWPSPNQYPHHNPPVNACGPVGAFCAYALHYYLGDGAYPLLLFATLAALLRLVRGELGHLRERMFGLALLVACTSVSAHLISNPSAAALPVGNGGLIGIALGEVMTENLSRVGTLIVLASSPVRLASWARLAGPFVRR